jgi:hypothetical protein
MQGGRACAGLTPTLPAQSQIIFRHADLKRGPHDLLNCEAGDGAVHCRLGRVNLNV